MNLIEAHSDDAYYNHLIKKIKEIDNNDTSHDFIESRYGRRFDADEVIEIINNNLKIYVVVLDDEVVGWFDIYRKDSGALEIGYAIFPEYQRQGYGYPMLEKLFEICSQDDDLKEFEIECEVTNLGSMKLVDKISEKYKPTSIEINTEYTPNTRIVKWKL